MPTTVLVPTTVSSLNANHVIFGGAGPAVLSDGSGASGYRASGEGSPSTFTSYFFTQGIPAASFGPFSNAQVFGSCFAADGCGPGEDNTAATGLNDGGDSLWNRQFKDNSGTVETSNNAYAASPYSGTFTLPTTAAGINAVTVLIRTEKNCIVNSRDIYEAYWKVDHFTSRGMMVAMIFSWLGPLVAVGLHEMPKLSRELFRRSLTLVRPDEFAWAWRAMRDDRAARYFL